MTASAILEYFRPWTPIKTLKRAEISELFREPFVLSGYRPINKDWSYYLKTLFQAHTETSNVWTHLVGTWIIMWSTYEVGRKYKNYEDDRSKAIMAFGICAAICTGASSIAHLLSSKSKLAHQLFFMLDYTGVSVYCFGSAFLFFYTGALPNLYAYLAPIFLPLNAALAWFVFTCCAVAKAKLNRNDNECLVRNFMHVGSVTAHTVLIIVAPAHRAYLCFTDSNCSQIETLGHHWLCEFLLVSSAVAFALHWPERQWPGRFDIIGHGHAIFHVICTMGMLSQIRAADIDLQRTQSYSQHLFPNLNAIFATLIIVILANGCTLFLLKPALMKNAKMKNK